MKKIFTKTLILLTLFFASCSTSSMITLMDSDAETEWNDGKLWAFKSNDNYMVAMTINTSKDDYGTYQLDLIVENLTDTSIVFDPSLIVVKIGSGPKIQQLATYEYPARKNANMAKYLENENIYLLTKISNKGNQIKQIGYLKKNTIYSKQGIIGYLNLEQKRFENNAVMSIEIPIDNDVFNFNWYISPIKN